MENLLMCEGCGWTGKEEDCIKTREADFYEYGIAASSLQCPKCESEKLTAKTLEDKEG